MKKKSIQCERSLGDRTSRSWEFDGCFEKRRNDTRFLGFWECGVPFAEMRNIRKSRMGDKDDEFGLGAQPRGVAE